MFDERQKSASLVQLAEEMIARHLRTSVPDSTVRDWLAAQRLDAYPTGLVASQTRCVVVVGAGASAPLLARSDDLAGTLEAKFGRDADELERLALVNNLDPEAFETRLIALSKTPDAARRVKMTISEQYAIRHPAVLAYELIAHLLKHRFVDAIVSFNFDELLDRSLDDELTATEYRRIVSERDCGDVQADADERDYIPLYIKLHGTASEPDSLRFTPDSYFTLQPRVVGVVQDLLHAERCVILNVGSGLTSFDFQRLLAIPDHLAVFNLSLDGLESSVCQKINDERTRARAARLSVTVDAVEPTTVTDWLHECATGDRHCDTQLVELTDALNEESDSIEGTAGPLVRFRSVRRHEVVAALLGSAVARGAGTEPDSWAIGREIEYLKRRAILELAFAGAKARGLLSLVPLSRDRPARYFELYQQRMSGNGDSWAALCSAAGLVESDTIPDVLESAPHLRLDPEVSDGPSDEGDPDPTHMLHEFDTELYARHIGYSVKNSANDDEISLLAEVLAGLQDQADVEFHTQDDRVCSKAFKQPVTLQTSTSLKVYTWLMLADLRPDDRVYMSAETGTWLLDEPIAKLLERQHKVRVLLAFDIEAKRLHERYRGEPMKLRVANPWHHNRHMTIVCRGDAPIKAIYFARHLRTPVITAVYLDSMRDVAHLMKTFRARWREATPCTAGLEFGATTPL